MKYIKAEDIIEFCNAQISHLLARKDTVALAQLRGVKDFVKDSCIDVYVDNYESTIYGYTQPLGIDDLKNLIYDVEQGRISKYELQQIIRADKDFYKAIKGNLKGTE